MSSQKVFGGGPLGRLRLDRLGEWLASSILSAAGIEERVVAQYADCCNLCKTSCACSHVVCSWSWECCSSQLFRFECIEYYYTIHTECYGGCAGVECSCANFITDC